MRITPPLVLALSAGLLLAGTSRAQAPPEPLRIVVLKAGLTSLELGYKAAEAQERLKAAISGAAGEELAAVRLGDVESWDWDRQALVLTAAATERLTRAVADGGYADDGARSIANMKKKLGLDDLLESGLHRRAFVVLARGEFVYGGVFVEPVSQMAIQFPVARASLKEGRVRLAFLPMQIPFVTVDPIDGAGAFRGLSITEVAKRDIAAMNANDDGGTKWLKGLSTSPSAVEGRKLLRDQRLRKVLEEAGKVSKASP